MIIRNPQEGEAVADTKLGADVAPTTTNRYLIYWHLISLQMIEVSMIINARPFLEFSPRSSVLAPNWKQQHPKLLLLLLTWPVVGFVLRVSR